METSTWCLVAALCTFPAAAQDLGVSTLAGLAGAAAKHAIRKVTPAGVVTTYAGIPGLGGKTDGTGGGTSFENIGGGFTSVIGWRTLPGDQAVDRAANR